MDYQIIFEIFIAIAVVFIQLYFFFSSVKKIKDFKNLLPATKLDKSFLQPLDTTNGTIQLIKIDTQLFSKPFTEVVDSINKYLIQNHGTIDYSIIKSTVERAIETNENSVSSTLTIPLYVGLMGTFVGIIAGLLKIAFGGGVTEQNINSFIGGVVIAMIASFFGLLLTVLNNSMNFRLSKIISDERKNNFYDFLQLDLLPFISNSLFDALDRLKYNINDFNKKFETNIQLFDSKFSVNITTLRDSVQAMLSNIGTIIENTKSQKEFLNRLDQIGYEKMASANARVFTLIDKVSPSILQFIEKQSELTASVEHAAQFIGIIESILNRIKTFEEGINNLGENINTKQYLGNEVLKRIDSNLSYLDKQYELLKQHGAKSNEKIDDYFTKQNEEIEKLSIRIRHTIEEAFNLKIENNPLQKLLLLETLDKNMEEIKGKINFNDEFKKISEEITSTKTELSDIKQKLIRAIEENKSRQTEVVIRDKPGENENSRIKKIPKVRKTVFNRLTNLFRWNRGRKA